MVDDVYFGILDNYTWESLKLTTYKTTCMELATIILIIMPCIVTVLQYMLLPAWIYSAVLYIDYMY